MAKIHLASLEKLIEDSEIQCAPMFAQIEKIEEGWTEIILSAMQEYHIAPRHFAPTTGYGYDDVGRDTLEKLFARIFATEDAIVRPQIASGTHALSLCLFGLTLPGDHILSVTGKPYDTMEDVLGIGEQPVVGSLKERKVDFSMVSLTKEGAFDIGNIEKMLRPNTKVIMVQRSRGYDWRPTLLPEEMESFFTHMKKNHPQIIIMVDNCYGEFVCEKEPSHVGADICAGSLIKNPGGGLAPTGGYIVGKATLIHQIATCLTAPGIGKEVGSYAGSYQPFYQGLFMAPHTVAQALKTMTLAARVFETLGFAITPKADERRGDIIQAIKMKAPEALIAFCQGIQMASPVDSMALPEPWEMPGYAHQVIMAAGTFVSGASIELSCDAPMKEPYILYLQGGLTYSHGKIALKKALSHMGKVLDQ
ncbi:MAG: hypothetical protein GX786_04275 [Clostridiales bacterium]|nr:hypothetical protein [Clostridiales bacterium]